MSYSEKTVVFEQQGHSSDPETEVATQELHRMVKKSREKKRSKSSSLAKTLVGQLVDPGDAGTLMMADDSGDLRYIQMAESCLVKAQAGDLVHAVLTADAFWVLAILKRAQPDSAVIMDLGGNTLHIRASNIEMQAVNDFRLDARVLTQTVLERQSRIANTDSTHAGNTVMHTERHMSLHARSSMVTAASLLKIDAAQIHMG